MRNDKYKRLCITAVCVIVWTHLSSAQQVRLDQEDEKIVVFHDDAYQHSFSEVLSNTATNTSNQQNKIQVSLNGTQLGTQEHYGWTAIVLSNGETIVSNSKINMSLTGTTFTMTVTYSTRALESYKFFVMDITASLDILLPTNTDAFKITCMAQHVTDDADGYTMDWVYSPNPKNLDWFPINSKSSRYVTATTTKSTTELSLEVVNVGNHGSTFELADSIVHTFSGVYACRFNTSEVTAYRQIAVWSEPIAYFEKPKEQYISGEQADFTCLVFGYPPPNVTWYFAKKEKGMKSDALPVEVVGDGDYQLALENSMLSELGFGGNIASSLIVSSLDDKKHRGLYRCHAENTYGEHAFAHYLRIRDKQAFIIPLAGIAIHLVALWLFIACCPNSSKRNRTQMQQRVETIAAQGNAAVVDEIPSGHSHHDRAGQNRKSLVRKTSLQHTPPLDDVDGIILEGPENTLQLGEDSNRSFKAAVTTLPAAPDDVDQAEQDKELKSFHSLLPN